MTSLKYQVNKKLSCQFLATITMTVALWGCGSDNDRLRERAQIEGEEVAKKAIEAETSNRESRVGEMEADLQKRQAFYQAVIGTYRGTRLWNDKKTDLQIVIKPSLSVYKPDRVRTIEEVQSDLTNLYLNVQVVSETENGQVGCLYSNIRPDLETGVMNLFSEACSSFPFFYSFRLSDSKEAEDIQGPTDSSRLAGSVLLGAVTQVQSLVIEERAKNSRALLEFQVVRSKNDVNSDPDLRTDREIETEKQIEVENENIRKRVVAMEADLSRRHRFYDAISGIFNGKYPKKTSGGEILNARVTMSKTSPYFKTDRVRTLEEVTNDLNNLSLNVQLSIWDSEVSIGCLFESVKPDLQTGALLMASENCSRSLTIDLGEMSSDIATAISKGDQQKAEFLRIEERLKFTGETLHYQLTR